MQTKLIDVTGASDGRGILAAAELLRKGELVAIPTETVYGLAANALDEKAVANIFKAKGRPQDNPLIVHISSLSMLPPLVTHIPEEAEKLAAAFWPGPLTMVLSKSPLVPMVTSGGLETVAIRMPSHPAARAIIEACGLPLAAPSANLSGSPSPTTAKHTMEDMNGRIAAVADGGPCEVGVESTVISLAGDVPRLLRPGGITPEQLREVLGKLEIDPAVDGQMAAGRASSPGMKYKHYAPKAQVTMVRGSLNAFIEYAKTHSSQGLMALCFDGEEELIPLPCVTYGHEHAPLEQARRLFTALRQLDEKGAKTVLARCPAGKGVGLAVFNRLQRAAAFRLITLEEGGKTI